MSERNRPTPKEVSQPTLEQAEKRDKSDVAKMAEAIADALGGGDTQEVLESIEDLNDEIQKQSSDS